MPFNTNAPNLIAPDDVFNLTGAPFAFFADLEHAVDLVNPDQIRDADLMRRIGERFVMDATFRPSALTPYAIACLRTITTGKRPTKSATEFGTLPLSPREVEDATGFSIRQLQSQASAELVYTFRFAFEDEVIEHAPSDKSRILRNGYVFASHPLAFGAYPKAGEGESDQPDPRSSATARGQAYRCVPRTA